ncbi:DUF1279 super [Taxawa tesnikishii (nom. ined.)]|nr:DUF1279 super [Dothideales sp. JES 119]
MNARKRLPEQTSSLGRIRTMRWNSSKSHPNPTQNLGSPEPQTLSARMKKLSREYGWSAMGVYLLLSALDFPFCFAAVRALGVDRISHWEHVVVEGFWKIVEVPFPNARKNKKVVEDAVVDAGVLDPDVREGGVGWGVEAAEKANKSDNASIWTQLALAYAIHKSFIFVRVPLTAAVTPKVVKTLRSWGWDIGKRKPKVKGNSKKDD